MVVCGGNIDFSTLRQVYLYGLRSLGRSFTINLTMSDSPGSVSYSQRASYQCRVPSTRAHCCSWQR